MILALRIIQEGIDLGLEGPGCDFLFELDWQPRWRYMLWYCLNHLIVSCYVKRYLQTIKHKLFLCLKNNEDHMAYGNCLLLLLQELKVLV